MIKRNLNYVENTVVFPKIEETQKLSMRALTTQNTIQTQQDVSTLEVDPLTYDDWWGDTYSSINGLTSGSLYYYYLDDLLIKAIVNTDEKKRRMCLIPPVDAIQSVTYQPYMEGEDLSMSLVTFDKQRMPIPTDKDTSFVIPPNMVRIKNMLLESKKVGAFLKYTKKPANTDGKRNYLMESKLQMYPYTYGMLADGIMDPMTFRYEYIENGSNVASVILYQPLTNQGTYAITLEKYKGDLIGTLEGNISNASLNLPIVSNAYVNYMSSNQAQNKLSMINAVMNTATGGVTGGISGFTTGGGVGAAVGALSGVKDGAMQIAGVMAQRKDLQNTPNTLKNSGGDVMFKRIYNDGYLNHYKFEITDTYKRILGDYFAMYGYKQNKVFTPDLRSRHYYNYIKTVNVNINGNGIPKEHLAKLEQIFDTGITIWHVDRNGGKINDYSMDNYEVNL